MPTKSNIRYARLNLTSAQKSLFTARTDYFQNVPKRFHIAQPEFSSGGYPASAYRPMTANIFGQDSMRRIELGEDYQGGGVFRSMKHYQKRVVSRTRWATFAGGTAEMTMKEFVLHLFSVAHTIPVNLEKWKIVLAQRALAVFRDSFRLKKWNSRGGEKWRKNTTFTIQKRRKNGTWPGLGGLMMETGELYKSLHIEKDTKSISVCASARYAGVHNNPESWMTYGIKYGAQPVVQRQFMGYSSYIDQFVLEYEPNYLFHDVFRKIR